ncbi:polysaccharide pyruvyl transferase family protein [Sodalis sp. RH18]
MTHDCLSKYISKEEPLAILDFPDIKNCGDSAIWLGEMAYLKDRFNKRPDYISRMKDFSRRSLEKSVPTGPIFIHGGGNFGDIWESHQDFREKILELLPKRKIIQFPQSIHYKSSARMAETAKIIKKHGNFVLLVRDVESFEFAKNNFECEVHLCPDMAFCIGAIKPAAPEYPVLAMLREDKEKVANVDTSILTNIPVEDWITESASSVRNSKIEGAITALKGLKFNELRLNTLDAAAHNRFQRGIRQISRGQAIVTDRLHVHICSLLIGRPHAVLDNSYGKIQRFMSAFSGGTELSYKAESLSDGVNWARKQAKSFS